MPLGMGHNLQSYTTFKNLERHRRAYNNPAVSNKAQQCITKVNSIDQEYLQTLLLEDQKQFFGRPYLPTYTEKTTIHCRKNHGNATWSSKCWVHTRHNHPENTAIFQELAGSINKINSSRHLIVDQKIQFNSSNIGGQLNSLLPAINYTSKKNYQTHVDTPTYTSINNPYHPHSSASNASMLSMPIKNV